ncbi:MAG TPA: Hpt domain-containing protein [Candidatus Cloacimonadota bacterium]|nr:Hpt domain-containing protein [Candidatus Cloacimonadota bacterium]HPT70955.1 Hpt domain-containing protein [Candidatus Cloacimonadota bacterium]
MKDGKLVKLQYLLESVGDDEELIREILDMFLQDTQDELEKMQLAVAEERWTDVARIAHRMKSSMLNLGLEEISQELLSIEAQIMNNNNSEAARQNVQRVFQICDEVFQDVRDIQEV